jgi:hypothetical protein
MSMTENMARVERMALRGVSIDQILALGLPLSPKTVASIVNITKAAKPAPAEEPTPEPDAALTQAEMLARYRIIDVRLGGVRRSIAHIIRDTAAKYGVSAADIVGRSRERSVLIPARQEAMYFCAKDTPYGMPEIGKAFNRDHTTVLHGIRKHCERTGIPLPRGMRPEGAN